MSTIQPTSRKERYKVLDVLRGFALIGVLIANMFAHSGYFFMTPEAQNNLPNAEAGNILLWIIHFTTDGKFYSIFSLLFGIGFALQLNRAKANGVKFTGRFMRRLFILLLFGILHAFLFFVGDILTVYALLGFVLLFFTKFSNRSLLIWTAILLTLPIFQYSLKWIGNLGNPPLDLSGQYAFFETILQTYKTGSYKDIIMINIGGTFFGRYPDLIFTGRFFKVLAMFLLGYWVARKTLFRNLETHISFFKKVVKWGFLIGIPCNTILAQMMTTDAYYNLAPKGIIQPLVYAFGVPALGLAYAAGLAWLYTNPFWQKKLEILAPFGQMALTNYITQSIICVFIYQSVGLGLTGEHGPVTFTLIGLCILLFQIVFSKLWLTKFRFGPLEWLWRSLTYLKFQPILKQQKDIVTNIQ
ncbi:DUF418 domain-containing protein [Galbibacter mesophilus]|uniref:DUF418 domain-containing protein n=1 Tax=Galbibacter mesophilus TaxID=379069 RepID=UPI00191CA769|nr:DUF418 domain-containing protein [Galbibacter mesophilus]MCM5661569.1 DUF418 domain-containing protein [Galbibacter mesophilus]